jgi:hypothetical protein
MRKGFSRKNRSENLKNMTRHDAHRPAPLAAEIRRQLGSPGVTRYLSSLPTFAVDAGMPESLRDLLSELQRAEAHRRGSGSARG